MWKKYVVWVLLLSFIGSVSLSGCKKDEAEINLPDQIEVSAPLGVPEDVAVDEGENDQDGLEAPMVDEVMGIVYEPVAIEPKVEPYTVLPDLSNIENSQLFDGFTAEQMSQLAKDGFVVLPGKDTKLNYVYDRNEYDGIPNFVTTDTVLHLYHQFYEKSLLYVENAQLKTALVELNQLLLQESIDLYEDMEDETLKRLALDNATFFLVGKMLLEGTPKVESKLPKEAISLAVEEYNLIQKTEGINLSPLLGEKIDYSQFRVRGHYTQTESLTQYFQTMMWYGNVPFELLDKEGKQLHLANTQKVLLMTHVALGNQAILPLWEKIYEPTGFYVGLSDDLNFLDMEEVLRRVCTDEMDLSALVQKDSEVILFEAVKALRAPQIVGKYVDELLPVGKNFRLMGQRYTLDSDIMQQLVEPYKRPLPSALDVMGILGSNSSETLLFDHLKPQDNWPEYETVYTELKAQVASYDPSFWQSNLYNGWLWAIKANLTQWDKKSGMPSFMLSDNWHKKALNASIGSYTELKHDTILYGKQSGAEMGGPTEIPERNQHYVEPNIEVYNRLYWLVQYTKVNLEAKGLLGDDFRVGIDAYLSLLELLKTCAIKELNNEGLNADEKEALFWVGGTLEYIRSVFYGAANIDEENPSIPYENNALVVTDVANASQVHLCLATGLFDEIYVIVPVGGKLYLTRGGVYSTYEFISDQRMTDEDWWELNGIKSSTIEETFESITQEEPSSNRPEQPFWINDFKSKVNKLVVERPEVDFSNLNE